MIFNRNFSKISRASRKHLRFVIILAKYRYDERAVIWNGDAFSSSGKRQKISSSPDNDFDVIATFPNIYLNNTFPFISNRLLIYINKQ